MKKGDPMKKDSDILIERRKQGAEEYNVLHKVPSVEHAENYIKLCRSNGSTCDYRIVKIRFSVVKEYKHG